MQPAQREGSPQAMASAARPLRHRLSTSLLAAWRRPSTEEGGSDGPSSPLAACSVGDEESGLFAETAALYGAGFPQTAAAAAAAVPGLVRRRSSREEPAALLGATLDVDVLVRRCAPRADDAVFGVYRRAGTDDVRTAYAGVAEGLKVCAAAADAALQDAVAEARAGDASGGGVLSCFEDFDGAAFPEGVGRHAVRLWLEGEHALCCLVCVSFLERLLTTVVVWLWEHGGQGGGKGRKKGVTMRMTKATDVMQSEPLAACFGAGFIVVLRALVGPLHGLMLRNLLWHDFVAPAEARREYAALLLLLSLSLPATGVVLPCAGPQGHVSLRSFFLNADDGSAAVEAAPAASDARTHAPTERVSEGASDASAAAASAGDQQLLPPPQPATGRAAPASSSFVGSAGHARFNTLRVAEERGEAHKTGTFFRLHEWAAHLRAGYGLEALCPASLRAAFRPDRVGVLQGVFAPEASPFFLESRRGEWAKAVRLCVDGRVYDACVLTTVLLESALRRVHVAVNDIDGRWKAPAEDELFLVIDDMLHPVLQKKWEGGGEGAAVDAAEEGVPNRTVTEFLSDGAAAVLYDHWVWKEGLRARDDVAHASLLPCHVPLDAVLPLLAVAAWCAAQVPTEEAAAAAAGAVEGGGDDSGDVESLRRRLCAFVDGYTPQLSPIALLQTELRLAHDGGFARLRATAAQAAVLLKVNNGFPPPPQAGAVTEEAGAPEAATAAAAVPATAAGVDVAAQNKRRADDPNHLPHEEAVLLEAALEKRFAAGGAGGGGGVAAAPPHPPIRSLGFQGKVTNVSSRRFVRLQTLRKIVASCHSFCERLADTFEHQHGLVWSRKAYKKQRIAYARLLEDVSVMASLVSLALAFVRVNASLVDTDYKNGDLLRERCLNFMCSLQHQAEAKQWSRCLPELKLFLNTLRTEIEEGSR